MKVLLGFCLLELLPVSIAAQKVWVKPQFAEGKSYRITVELTNTVSQHAAGQPIDFTLSGDALHSYRVTAIDSGAGRISFHHQAHHIAYSFEGMGQEKNFDSRKETDMNDKPGSYFKEFLGTSFDLITDSTGTAIQVTPDKIVLSQQEGGMIIILHMLKELTDIVYPPQQGAKSFFAVLPPYPVGAGDTWTDSLLTENEKSVTENSISAITDSTIVINFKTKAFVVTKMQMMGGEAISAMNSSATGQIVVDRRTGIIIKKTTTADASGTTETMAGAIPTTGKLTLVLSVKEE